MTVLNESGEVLSLEGVNNNSGKIQKKKRSWWLIGLQIVGLISLLIILGYFVIFDNVQKVVESTASNFHWMYGWGSGVLAFIIAALIARPIYTSIGRAFIWKLNARDYIIFGICILSVIVSSYFNRNKFFAKGAGSKELCPALLAQGLPTIKNLGSGADEGITCMPLTKKEASLALAIDGSKIPKEIITNSILELDALMPFNPNGSVAIYIGETWNSSHKLYDGPGFNPNKLGILSPITNEEFMLYKIKQKEKFKDVGAEKVNEDIKKLSFLKTNLSNLVSEIRMIESEKNGFNPSRTAVPSGGIEIPDNMDVYETGPRVITGLHKKSNKPIAIVTSEHAKVWEVFISASPSWIVLIDRNQKERFSKLSTLYLEKSKLSDEINLLERSLPEKPKDYTPILTNEIKTNPEMKIRIEKMEEERRKNMAIVNDPNLIEIEKGLVAKKTSDLKVTFRIEFLNRDPSKSEFVFLANVNGESNRVKDTAIRIVSEGCPKSYISVDEGPEIQICNGHIWDINPGQVWRVRNDFSAIKSRNVRVDKLS